QSVPGALGALPHQPFHPFFLPSPPAFLIESRISSVTRFSVFSAASKLPASTSIRYLGAPIVKILISLPLGLRIFFAPSNVCRIISNPPGLWQVTATVPRTFDLSTRIL